jgi:NhaP-type Na+/H+ or K+/H+ antiporter
MLIIGIVLGPYVLNLISPSILDISADLRKLALIIILTRAGLSLDFGDLKKAGTSAILMCFVPATLEILGYVILAPLLMEVSLLNAALLGTVMAAVSPAVVVPRMLKIKEQGYGINKGIPQMITAGASVDDVFVIVLFTAFLAMSSGGDFSWNILWQIPVSIILGIAVGLGMGILFSKFFKTFHMRDSIKVIILISFSLLFITLENLIEPWVPFSGLLAVISMGASFYRKHEVCADRLSIKYSKLWIVAEIFLFVLVGATVDIKYAVSSGWMILVVILIALLFRMVGVFVSTLGSKFNTKEKLFCMIAYSPKATVQAAIGAIPLAMGLSCGNMILTAAVIAILVTAPIGALATDFSYKKLLKYDLK